MGTPVPPPLLPPFSFCFLPPGEIALLEGLTVVYKSSIDLYFYVIGSSYENEVRLTVRVLPLTPLLKPQWDTATGLGLTELRSSAVWQGHKEVCQKSLSALQKKWPSQRISPERKFPGSFFFFF